MQNLFRYTDDERPIKLSGEIMQLFDVMAQVDTLDRVGERATATKIGKRLGISVYKTRKMLHSMHEIGLVHWVTVDHRPNVMKRIYVLTARGVRTLRAYDLGEKSQ